MELRLDGTNSELKGNESATINLDRETIVRLENMRSEVIAHLKVVVPTLPTPLTLETLALEACEAISGRVRTVTRMNIRQAIEDGRFANESLSTQFDIELINGNLEDPNKTWLPEDFERSDNKQT